jgi:type I restriction enzyme S subunit
LLLTQNFTDYAILGSQRAGMPKVNREHLFAYKLHIPSLAEQHSIVQKLDTLSAETKKLEAIYRQKISDLEEMKKSILQKAFAGELKTGSRPNE